MKKTQIAAIAHGLVYRTCVAFTLLVLAFTTVTYISASNGSEMSWIPSAIMLFSILLFSLIYAFSCLIFNAKKLGDTPKRIIHVILNYINMWICFFLIPGNVREIKEFIIFSFVYFLMYVVLLGIGSLLRKTKEKLG